MSCSKKWHQIISLHKQALYCPVLIVFQPLQKQEQREIIWTRNGLLSQNGQFFVFSSQKQCMFAIFRSIFWTSIRDRSRCGKALCAATTGPFRNPLIFLASRSWLLLLDSSRRHKHQAASSTSENLQQNLTVLFWPTDGFHRVEWIPSILCSSWLM